MPIFDQGYQHWQGPLSGHGVRWLAVARHGVRAQLKNRFVRLLLLVAWIPALALVTFLSLWGLLEQQAESVISLLQRLLPPEMLSQPRDFRAAVWTVAYTYFFKAELVCSLFLVTIVGPNLVSRDLRFNALPLYLSRPVRRIDYFLGKLGVIGFFLAATVVVPALGAYALGLAFSLDLGVVRDTHRLLWGGVLYGLVIALACGALMLALSSLSRRSIYVGLAWAGLIFLSHMISSVLVGLRDDTERRHIVEKGIEQWVKDHPPPPGIEMRGWYPITRYGPARSKGPDARGPDAKAPDAKAREETKEERAREQWMRGWVGEMNELRTQAEDARAARGYTDWRPTLSFAKNLDRLGDALLDADGAWVLLGRTVERPRQILEIAKGRNPPQQEGTLNERRLADQRVWQFPWYWSAGVLAGVCVLSALVLSRRVKSLDRLK
jgi:ABC-type transport system involved in multi-copper enzyme maturation permease subunit